MLWQSLDQMSQMLWQSLDKMSQMLWKTLLKNYQTNALEVENPDYDDEDFNQEKGKW